MPRIIFLLINLLTVKSALLTDQSLVDKFEKLYEQLDSLTLSPLEKDYELESNREEMLLQAMKEWGKMSDAQLDTVAKEIQDARDLDYSDDWSVDVDPSVLAEDYAMDGSYDWEDDETSTSRPQFPVTPSPIIRPDRVYTNHVVGTIDPIDATQERPRVLDNYDLSPEEISSLRTAAFKHMHSALESSECLTPQPRWLVVRHMVLAPGIKFMPPCVKLHRCMPDSACCRNLDDVCAPVDGRHVVLPFLFHKANGDLAPGRVMFYNHTRCACVSRQSLSQRREIQEIREEPQLETVKDWRTTEEPLERDEEISETAPMRRCICPGLFQAKSTMTECTCVCESKNGTRRRDCLSLAKGKEHFGMKDRACIDQGDCQPPTCVFGNYDGKLGRCPLGRRYRRIGYRKDRSYRSGF